MQRSTDCSSIRRPRSRALPACRSSTTDFRWLGAGSPKSDVDTVTIEVGDVNTAPVNTVPAAQTIDQDGMLLFSSATGTAIIDQLMPMPVAQPFRSH